MTVIERVVLAFQICVFVFFFLAALAPTPSDQANGDHRMVSALIAATAAALAFLVAA